MERPVSFAYGDLGHDLVNWLLGLKFPLLLRVSALPSCRGDVVNNFLCSRTPRVDGDVVWHRQLGETELFVVLKR